MAFHYVGSARLFMVDSHSRPNLKHLVAYSRQFKACTCEDFTFNAPDHVCKHIKEVGEVWGTPAPPPPRVSEKGG